MHIIVCIKQVPDPEGPPSSFVINQDLNRVEPQGIAPVLSLFDENALEAALKIKDADRDNTKITILSIGNKISNAVMSKALAVGADELLKVEDELLASNNLDSYSTASALASAIRKMGEYDLILLGRQAADWNAGQAGIGLAEILGTPIVTLAKGITIDAGNILVERVLPNGFETVSSPLPCVVMVSNEVGEMRYPTLPQRKQAKKKKVTTWAARDIGIDGPLKNKVVLHGLFTPVMREGQCTIIEGTSPEDSGKNLAKKLRDDSIL